jgi:hypothetical protein
MFKNYQSIAVGDNEEITKKITRSDVDLFVKMTGDNNPLHVIVNLRSKLPTKILSSTGCWELLLFQL